MRLPTALLVCLVSAFAAQAEDRFGPPPTRSVAAEAAANGFGAPVYNPASALRWSRKAASQDVASADILILQPQILPGGLLSHTSASPMARNRPMASIGGPAPSAAPPTYGPPASYAAPSPALRASVAPNAGAQIAPAPAPHPVMREALAAPLPTTLFDDTAGPQPTLAASAVAAAAAPAVMPRGQAIGPNGEVGSRYYSVHRSYGVDADPIPMTQTGVGQ